MARFASTIRENVDVTFDLQASAMSLDATGSFAVLAGRRGLHLVDLETPYVPATTLHHQTRWDVAVVRCSPHVAFKHWAASSSNHNVLLWDLSACAQPLVATLRAHTRPVNDVAWSPHDPTLLATCGADTKTHLWDTRAPQRPVHTLAALTAGATLAEWHRVDATTLATAHEGEVRVWDTRATDKTPAVLITAHVQKICAIDWHPKHLDELLTCADDKTVKFWSVSQPKNALGSIATPMPASSAKYTPFGDGVVTSYSRQEPVVRLWNLAYAVNEAASVTATEVYSFHGHTDSIKSIEWRERASMAGTDYQLVSWAKHQELRLWRMERHHLDACGFNADDVGVNGLVMANQQNELELQQQDEGISETELQRNKYDVSMLKSDVNRVVVAPQAVPLGAAEYSIVQPGGDKDSKIPLTFDDDVSKIGDGQVTDEDTDDDEDTQRESLSGNPMEKKDLSSGTATAASGDGSDGRVALPCPRISGGCFSGPNILVVFDSRSALTQARRLTVTPSVAPVAPGKANKAPSTSSALKKLPRTYEQLLDGRDSRGGRRKSKKLAKMVSHKSSGLSSLDMGMDWAGSSLDLLDGAGYGTDDGGDHSVHGYRTGRGSRGGGLFGSILESRGDPEHAVHGGSEWANMYFANSELHLAINHPDHRISLPPSNSMIQGLSLSPPRSTVGNGFRSVGYDIGLRPARRSAGELLPSTKRTKEQTAGASLQSDLNLMVTLVDLSQLCGVSPVLTYGLRMASRATAEPARRDDDSTRKKLDAGSRDLYSWMLKAARSRRVSDSSTAIRRVRRDEDGGNGGIHTSPGSKSQGRSHPLTRILESFLQPDKDDPTSVADDCQAVSDVCAHNARIASLSGRRDLQQVWSLLELSTAAVVDQAQQQYAKTPMNVESLATAHQWSAHPFGQGLVKKVLGMYENVGDVPTLASIVCTLQSVRPKPDEPEQNHTICSSAQLTPITTPRRQQPGGTSVMTTAATASSSASSTPVVKPMASPFSRSRTSFNSLTQLLSGQSDTNDPAPPAMRSARRSSSHNEVPKLSQLHDRGDSPSIKPGAKEWPMAPRSAQAQTSPRMGPAGSSGWKVEFDKVENPLRTWGSGSAAARADASPRPLTADPLTPPLPPMSAHQMHRRRRESSIVDGDDEVSLLGRLVLHVDKRPRDQVPSVLSTHEEDTERYDRYKDAYADLLYRYGALDLRSAVLKTSQTNAGLTTEDEDEETEALDGLAFGVLCRSCQAVTDQIYCSSCRDFAVKCSICMLTVRGQSMYCMTCGHGGHAHHIREWFEEEDACPTGCGCWCKQATVIAPNGAVRHSHGDLKEAAAAERMRSYSF